jgi:hypothetical protein
MTDAARQIDLLTKRAHGDRNREARIQAAIIEWIRLVAPQVLAFHVPNGGLRTKSEAARLRWVGVLAGVPDLIVLAPVGKAFCLEVKPPGEHLSPEQREIFDTLTATGISCAVVHSIDDARRAFKAWGVETRETVV